MIAYANAGLRKRWAEPVSPADDHRVTDLWLTHAARSVRQTGSWQAE